jgi:hypothetical protein
MSKFKCQMKSKAQMIKICLELLNKFPKILPFVIHLAFGFYRLTLFQLHQDLKRISDILLILSTPLTS